MTSTNQPTTALLGKDGKSDIDVDGYQQSNVSSRTNVRSANSFDVPAKSCFTRQTWIGIGIVATIGVILITVLLAIHINPSSGGDQPDLTPLQLFQNFIDNSTISANLFNITYYSHIAGSDANHRTALHVAEQWKLGGIEDVEIEAFDVYLSKPISRSVQVYSNLQSPAPFYNCTLKEIGYARDNSSYNRPAVDTFLSYSANGTVKAEVVYANYGSEGDFQTLQYLNISTDKKIIIMRYGQIFRGNMAWNAQMAGAAGCLIYSDPFDDG